MALFALALADIACSPGLTQLLGHHHGDQPIRAPRLLHLVERRAEDIGGVRIGHRDRQCLAMGCRAQGCPDPAGSQPTW